MNRANIETAFTQDRSIRGDLVRLTCLAFMFLPADQKPTISPRRAHNRHRIIDLRRAVRAMGIHGKIGIAVER